MTTSWMKYESATCKFVNWDENIASITNLYSKERGKGHARKLLNLITDIADQNDITLQLVAQPYGPRPYGLSTDDLIKFYESCGFVLIKHMSKKKNYMVRLPRIKNNAYNEPLKGETNAQDQAEV